MSTVRAERTPVTAAFSSFLGKLYRMVRLLHLRDGFGTRLQFGLLPELRSARRNPAGIRYIRRRRDHAPPGWHRLRPLRRQDRPQVDAGLDIDPDGRCATVLIGLVPSYAQIGILAPILLIVLRCVQGIAFGGEWAGAALIAVEHAPEKRQGFFGSFPQIGSPIALFLATGTFALLATHAQGRLHVMGMAYTFRGEAPCSS